MSIELTDGTILLRAWREDDIDALYEAVRESFAELAPWMPWCHENYRREDSATFILSREEAVKNETDYSFAVVEPETQVLLGSMGLNQFTHIHRMANLGYWVRTSRTGRGVALRATLLGARFGFEQLKLERIEIMAAVGNLASQRVAEKAGAVREGVLRKRLWVGEQPHDAVMFSLIKEDLGLPEEAHDKE
ncbi:MAG: GNAT family N-acetyltransferase [Acidobacteria bacterium]|nr:GNAT family N-acetyltransferase [Acidobacteriota bacterium]